MLISYKKPRGRFFIVGKPGGQPVAEWTVTVTAGSNGSVSVDGVAGDYVATVPDGTVLTLSATASEHYSFSQWSDGSTSATRTVTVTGDLNLTASFAIDTYIVNVVAGANGSVSVDGVSGNYSQYVPYGTQLEVEATPAIGYDFTAWSDGDGNSQRIIAVTGDVTLSAAFAIQTFSVSVTAGQNGSVSVNGTAGNYSQTVSYGTVLVIEATGNTGYSFTQWSDGSSTNPRTVTIASDLSLTSAYAIQTFSVSLSAGANGSVSVNGTPVVGTYTDTVGYGTQITIEATPDSHYSFTQWSDGVSTNPRTLTVTSNTTLSAAFAIDTYNVSVSAGANGSVSVNGTPVVGTYTDTVSYGTALTLAATGDTGYGFDQWSDGNTDNPRSLTVTSNVTLSAAFEAVAQYYNVSISSGANGSITVDNVPGPYSASVLSGTQLTLAATGDAGYTFTQWSDGDTSNPRTLTVTSDVTLAAAFQAAAPQQPNNEIWYTSSDGNVVAPYSTGAFSPATITSNTYADGKGTIVFDQPVASIGQNAFQNCTGLTSVNIPSGVTSIGGSAFAGCSGLASVTIGSGVTSIGGTAFNSCGGLTSITVSSGNTTYDSRGGCNAIIETSTNTLVKGCENTAIPSTVTSIGMYAFNDCFGLASITIPSGVTSIALYAFLGCTGLTSITFKSTTTVPTVDSSSFSQVASTGTVYGQSGLDYSAVMAALPSGWTLIILSPDNEIRYTSSDGQVVTPNDSTAFGTATITSNTYADGKGTIVFDQPLATVGDVAFQGCSTLASITMPSGVTGIGIAAFQSCSSLASIAMSDSVTGIGDYAFAGCALTAASFGGITAISDNMYRNNDGLTTVTIPNRITSVGEGAFIYCDNLTSVTVGTSVASVGDNAFTYCPSLNEITFQSATTVPTLGQHPFDGVASTGTVYGQPGLDYSTVMAALPSGWTLITQQPQPDNEIWYTSSDGQVVTPNDSTAFGTATITSNTYADGKGTIVFDQPVASIGQNAFQNCTGLTSVTIPNGVTSIGIYAFRNCTSLASITIPDSVMSIGTNAFNNCTGLTSVNIPSGVTSIALFAFRKCSSLASITFESTTTVPTVDSTSFSQVASTGTVYGQPGLDYSTVMAALPSGWTLVQ